MERHYFGLSTLLVSVALLIWSIGETFAYPQGPNVSMGSNPIVSFSCANGVGYTVPSGFDLIVTDVDGYSGSGGWLTIRLNGSAFYRVHIGTYQSHLSYKSGIKLDSGTNVDCTGALYLSGYLAHQ